MVFFAVYCSINPVAGKEVVDDSKDSALKQLPSKQSKFQILLIYTSLPAEKQQLDTGTCWDSVFNKCVFPLPVGLLSLLID